MLNDLRKYDCLGTPNYFFELFNALKNNPSNYWERDDLEKVFYNRVIDNRPVIDGGIEIALRIKILEQTDRTIKLNPDFEDHLNNVSQMIDRFNHFLFETVREDSIFLKIFSSRNLSYDLVHKALQIDNLAFGFKYANFKQLLLDFRAIKIHPTREFKSYVLNQHYKYLFDKSILPEIKKRKIGVEEFQQSLEQRQIYGEEAEKFVLKFELNRLENKKKVDWVAEYIVNEGYDISSYNTPEDELPNRFIEVKSYDGPKPYFYWSKNEYQVAKLRKMEYWIYLVDRSKVNTSGYQPIQIQNPYINVLSSVEWVKEVDAYRISAQ